MGFPNQFFNDSGVVGLWRAGHAYDYDGRGRDDRFAGISSVALVPRRQGPGRSEVSPSLALFRGPQHHLARSSGPIRPLKQHLETVWRLSQAGTFEAFFDGLAPREPPGAGHS